MVLKKAVDGLPEFLQLVGELEDKTVFALFCGGKDSNGESWCPDCVSAEPVIEKALPGAPADAVFIYCSVGDRPTWKNPSNEFRTHPKLTLNGVPTLLQWGTPKRLVEEQCSKDDLVQMFFQED